MNEWTRRSIELANRQNYLDMLYSVYPISPNPRRVLDPIIWNEVVIAFNSKNNNGLIRALLKFDLFPIKDSYIAHLRKDDGSITYNPETIYRICKQLYNMGLVEIKEKCTEPKETNRQIGPLFKNWVKSGVLGLPIYKPKKFESTNDDAILDASDEELKKFAIKNLGYTHGKGLDLVARVNGKYVIAEAKFLSDTGGHQNAQFEDAMSTLSQKINGTSIAILDGVLYIKGETKMHKGIKSRSNQDVIVSALLLKDYLYSLR